MTTIVAAEIKTKKKRKVVFASDSQVSYGARKESLPDGKIIRNGPIVFGFAGSVRVLNVLKHADLPKPPKSSKREDVERWAITKLIPAMRHALKHEDAAEIVNSEINMGSSLLVSVNNRLFEISSNFAFTVNDARVYSVGSGSSYALGALGAGADPESAIRVASFFDVWTGGEVFEVVLNDVR